ncbi:MAG TPA: hypothetical protein ENJ00_00370 [Phycisphaerales bacterium]|nr:hypothetical protein [Phycisphaerales bacterium]
MSRDDACRESYDQFDDDMELFEEPTDELDYDPSFPDGTIDDELESLLSLDEHVPDQVVPKLAESEKRYEGPDRRKNVMDARPSGLERRRGPGRRLTDFVKSAEEGEMNAEQFLFLRAIETFKAVNNKSYPNWTDVLEVVRLLGYRKTLPSELNLRGVDDWTEKPDAPSCVRDRAGVSHKRNKAA